MMKSRLNLIYTPAFLVVGILFTHSPIDAAEASKKTIGETARITVEEAQITYLARIDTGANKTSMNALDLQVAGGSENKKEDVGKQLSFTTENEHQQKTRITATIVDVVGIRNAQGREDRYVVELNLNWHGITKKALVNLRDRSHMRYKLLIGRSWLANDFVVDVDISEGKIKK